MLLSSASAGAFNQYVESDIDRQMMRTRKRAFVTGALPRTQMWLWVIVGLVALSAAAAWWALNPWAALYTFLGAFFYAVVYTVWLKRRTWLNIVVGGLAGSFAVLAGAAAVDPAIGTVPLILALVHVPVDATPFLEPCHRLSQGLRGGGRADAAGGGRERTGRARDPVAHDPAGIRIRWPQRSSAWAGSTLPARLRAERCSC